MHTYMRGALDSTSDTRQMWKRYPHLKCALSWCYQSEMHCHGRSGCCAHQTEATGRSNVSALTCCATEQSFAISCASKGCCNDKDTTNSTSSVGLYWKRILVNQLYKRHTGQRSTNGHKQHPRIFKEDTRKPTVVELLTQLSLLQVYEGSFIVTVDIAVINTGSEGHGKSDEIWEHHCKAPCHYQAKDIRE